MKYIFSLAFLCVPFLGQAQSLKLSPEVEIMVITCGPGQDALYSAFGHSALRVVDSINGVDLVYNYGMFDFDQPHFYANFAKGYLRYSLAVSRYEDFMKVYRYYKRSVHEQVLNLDQGQKQKLFDFLQWNAQPENRYYFYDYFYDNCSTRIREALKKVLGEALVFKEKDAQTGYSIRTLTDMYLHQQPWGDFGIDLALGLPMDREATNEIATFLPDYLEKACNNATVKVGGEMVPLVKTMQTTYEPSGESNEFQFFTPLFLTLSLLLLTALITFFDTRNHRVSYGFDILLFGIAGLVGCILLFLWWGTDHRAAARNFNLLWAVPSHLVFAFFLFKREKPKWVRGYFIVTGVMSLLLLVFWYPIPQKLHYAVIPLVLAFGMRCFLHYILEYKLIKPNRVPGSEEVGT